MQEQTTEAAAISQAPASQSQSVLDPIELDIRRKRLNQRRKSKLTWDAIARRVKSYPVEVSRALNPQKYPGDRNDLLWRINRLLTRLEREQAEKAA